MVLMPPSSPSAVGLAEIRKTYDAVFAVIQLTVKFKIAEIVEISPDGVFARGNSAGATLNHVKGAISKEGSQELFIFRKEKDGNSGSPATAFSLPIPRRFEVLSQS
jgi:ketosteroid isomerase-like protein